MILADPEDLEIAPQRLGFCSNFIGAFEMCGKAVFESDIEAVKLPMKNNRRQFICGHCCEGLLSGKPMNEEPEKGRPREKQVKRTGARLPMGEDLKKR